MCLDSTKQEFLLLKAFSLASGSVSDFDDLIARMHALSVKTFGSDRYVRVPRPLVKKMREKLDDGEIAPTKDGWAITKRGKSNLVDIENNYVKVHLARVALSRRPF